MKTTKRHWSRPTASVAQSRLTIRHTQSWHGVLSSKIHHCNTLRVVQFGVWTSLKETSKRTLRRNCKPHEKLIFSCGHICQSLIIICCWRIGAKGFHLKSLDGRDKDNLRRIAAVLWDEDGSRPRDSWRWSSIHSRASIGRNPSCLQIEKWKHLSNTEMNQRHVSLNKVGDASSRQVSHELAQSPLFQMFGLWCNAG